MWQPPAHYPYPPYSGMQGGSGGAAAFPSFGYPYPYMYPHPAMGPGKHAEPTKKKRGRPSKRKKRNKQAKAEVCSRICFDRCAGRCERFSPVQGPRRHYVKEQTERKRACGLTCAMRSCLAGSAKEASNCVCHVFESAPAGGQGRQPAAYDGGNCKKARGNVARDGTGRP